MATTSQPLVWDYCREVTGATNLGGVLHYYDEESQSLYLDGGLATKLADISEGHWSEATQGEEIQVNTTPWTKIRLEHPSNGMVYGVVTNGTSIAFIRYIYAMDIAYLLDDWSWTMQSDSPICQFSGSVYNVDAFTFLNEAGLFLPGSKVELGMRMGDSEVCKLGIAYLDEIQYDVTGETVSISGRNSIGYFLKDQTFDEKKKYEQKLPQEIIGDIFSEAGIENYNIQQGTAKLDTEFDPDKDFMSALDDLSDTYSGMKSDGSGFNNWRLVEMADGTVLAGYDDYHIVNFLPNGTYQFNEGKDVFTRSTTKNADGAYTHVRLTGENKDDPKKDDNGNIKYKKDGTVEGYEDHTPIVKEINSYAYWQLGKHKTAHVKAPKPYTVEKFTQWANLVAKTYQYIGIKETFTGPPRPQLIPGDIAEVLGDKEQTTILGTVTEVVHKFTKNEGFTTEFTVDSGGISDTAEHGVYTKTASVRGLNRKQTMMDIVRAVAKGL